MVLLKPVSRHKSRREKIFFKKIMMKLLLSIAVFGGSNVILAFQRPLKCHSIMSPLKSSDSDLNGLQTSLFNSLDIDLGLKLTDFTDTYDCKNWKEGDFSGSTGYTDQIIC